MSASTITEAIYGAICEEVRAEVCERMAVPQPAALVLPRRLRNPSNTNAPSQPLPSGTKIT